MPGQNLNFLGAATGAKGLPWGTDTTFLQGAELSLHYAILQGVEGDHHQTATFSDGPNHGAEALLQIFQFVIDGNA